jgi:hypothetical protein
MLVPLEYLALLYKIKLTLIKQVMEATQVKIIQVGDVYFVKSSEAMAVLEDFVSESDGEH